MGTQPPPSPTVPRFDRFAAIDWSGARGTRHRGIAIAVAEAGHAAPRLVAPPHPAGWARAEVADWLASQPGRLLVGFDFSFAPPFLARGAYLPGLDTPDNAPAFWAWLERQCADPDLGAHEFILGPARAHFWLGAADGRKRDFLHWRACERAFNAMGGGKASTVFDCVGAAQVAKASFSGMRLLARVAPAIPVWPFMPPRPQGPLVVEIYTRSMLRHAGGRGLKLREPGALASALAALDSEAPRLERWPSDHETDVLVSAAALRSLAPDPRWWSPDGLTPEIARTEGWTFGIG
ncbi:MAG: hypothetical protein ACK4Z0_02510 [Sphingomonadaceae bacterium]